MVVLLFVGATLLCCCKVGLSGMASDRGLTQGAAGHACCEAQKPAGQDMPKGGMAGCPHCDGVVGVVGDQKAANYLAPADVNPLATADLFWVAPVGADVMVRLPFAMAPPDEGAVSARTLVALKTLLLC